MYYLRRTSTTRTSVGTTSRDTTWEGQAQLEHLLELHQGPEKTQIEDQQFQQMKSKNIQKLIYYWSFLMDWDYKAFSFWNFSDFTKFSRYHFILWPLLFKHKTWAIKCLNTYFAFIISTSTTEKHPASPIPRFLILTPHLPENKFVGYTLHRLKEANLTSGISTPLFWNPVSALVWTTTLFRLKGRAALLEWKGRSIIFYDAIGKDTVQKISTFFPV